MRSLGFPVKVTEVSKVYSVGDQTIYGLRDVTIGLEAGSIVAVVGPSGSGKSSLLHMVGAMDVVTSGSISVGPFEVTSLSKRKQVDYRRSIGFVFQRYHLLPTLTARDNVVAPLLPRKVEFDKFERGQELLSAVGLGDRGSSLPAELSGGQQQRVAIARALVNSPGLLLADEPTGNLDSATGSEVIDVLVGLRNERHMTILIATHDLTVAAKCDRVVSLQDGQLVHDTCAIAPPEHIEWRPRTPDS